MNNLSFTLPNLGEKKKKGVQQALQFGTGLSTSHGSPKAVLNRTQLGRQETASRDQQDHEQ